MDCSRCRGVVLWLALCAAIPAHALGQASAQAPAKPPAAAPDDLEARVKQAHEAASANAATPEGREWKEQKAHTVDRLMIVVLNRCLPETPDEEIPTAFSVYVRLSKTGQVREIVTELDKQLSTCMTATARNIPFPDAPRDDYWIQVNMAAPL
jgi:hypothetical protein